jgi:UDP-N-acetylmuramyl pentapeptide phosphotransferase/UDP-N-acetylglucosamine-1-phosphate transferase
MQGLSLFLVSAVVSCGLGVPIQKMLVRWNIIDHPNERSSHNEPTARGGGLAIIFTILAGSAWLIWRQPDAGLTALAIGAALLALVSWFDDRKSLPTLLRFGCHGIAAFLVLYALHWPTLEISLHPGSIIWSSSLVGIVLLFLWLTGYTNAFNFMDGINGIAAGQAVLTGIGTALIARLALGTWDSPVVLLSLALAGAALGFLPHNFPRARMFMGDVGSAPLGFLLASLVLWAAVQGGWWLLIPLLLLHTNFILDTGITLVRRIVTGQRWYAAHREHFYQHLVRAGKSHAFVTGWEMGLQVFTWLLMVAYIKAGVSFRLGLVLGVLAIWGGFFFYCESTFRRTRFTHPSGRERF